MTWHRADLHLHSVLSSCATLDMSPQRIIEEASAAGLQIIALTDHNSTRNALLCQELAAEKNIFCLLGVEINTKEEVHCLLLVEKTEQLEIVENFLSERLPDIRNNPELFGYQLVLDRDENIIEQVDKLLINAVSATLDEIAELSETVNGILILAHIDKSKNSILSQLGFIPPDLNYTALEISRNGSVEQILSKQKYLAGKTFISASDAHQPDLIGKPYFEISCEEINFQSIKNALLNNQVKL